MLLNLGPEVLTNPACQYCEALIVQTSFNQIQVFQSAVGFHRFRQGLDKAQEVGCMNRESVGATSRRWC